MRTYANRNTLLKNIQILIQHKQLQQNGTGKGTWYSLALV